VINVGSPLKRYKLVYPTGQISHASFKSQNDQSYLHVSLSISNNRFLFLLLPVKPLWIKLLDENIPFSAEHAHAFRCEVVGARPSPNITWWRDNTQLFNSKDVVSAT
jgi:CD80-like C2-set immunoglobulin domain.